jgi:tetratricopeptide (TPR) repeat protein
MLLHVRHGCVAGGLGKEGKMTRMRFRKLAPSLASVALLAAFASTPALAGRITFPAQAEHALDEIYSGNPDDGIASAQEIERAQPQSPLGYAIEAEARWWKIYCESCDVQWGMVDAWKGGKGPESNAYLALAEKVVRLANEHLASSDTAEMHFYAGMGWALEARLYGLRNDRSKTARTGVEARKEFLRALKLDPSLADADVGLGLYNYYVDTLSPLLKFLRFFMGIPGGSKKDGIRQLENGMNHGVLLATVARFYLAKSLRTYDHQYEQALSVAEPLTKRFPRNPIFLLLVGNLNAELGRDQAADTYFRTALNAPATDTACALRVNKIANSFLSKASR